MKKEFWRIQSLASSLLSTRPSGMKIITISYCSGPKGEMCKVSLKKTVQEENFSVKTENSLSGLSLDALSLAFNIFINRTLYTQTLNPPTLSSSRTAMSSWLTLDYQNSWTLTFPALSRMELIYSLPLRWLLVLSVKDMSISGPWESWPISL